MPHVPIYASEDFLGTSERGLYGDVVQELDWSVGQILEKLEQLNLLENTLVIFSGDNGPWLVMEDHGG
ncbi:N-acetylgalactosamine-6-O-sulfatase [subsurface metagenome]